MFLIEVKSMKDIALNETKSNFLKYEENITFFNESNMYFIIKGLNTPF